MGHPTLSSFSASIRAVRAAAILGLGCSGKDLRPFQKDGGVEWRVGVPGPGEADAVLVFGGDGTIHRHLGLLVRLGLPVLIVPAGSGNDFARALGLRSVRDSIAAWKKFCASGTNVRAIDLGIVLPLENVGAIDLSFHGREIPTSGKTGQKWGTPDSFDSNAQSLRYFCGVAGVGLDAEVSRKANALPRWVRGNGGYALALLPTIFRFAPVGVRISEANSGNVLSEGPTMLAAFANTPLYGGGMKIAPRARMDDGLLDVCVVEGVGAVKLFFMFPTVYGGRHLGIREVKYFQTARVRVETELPRDLYADGEFVCRTPAEIGVERKALRVIGA